MVGDATQFTNDYAYDADGDMTQVTQTGSSLASKEADFAYNGDGQLTGMSLLAGGDAVALAAYGHVNGNDFLDFGQFKCTGSLWRRCGYAHD